jgi:PadR family transcriptional regulator, regulatory protein PadR
MNLKGSLPLLILYNLRNEPNHGYAIAKHIKQTTNGVLDFKEGTLYPTLHGMQKQGLVEMYKEKVNGRNRSYYRLTDKGRKMLKVELNEWHEFTAAVNSVLEGAS